MMLFSQNESFKTIKVSFHYSRKICIIFSSKIPVTFGAYFSVKETSVFSFDDVVLSKGGFLDNKIVNVRGKRCRNIFENISRSALIKIHFFTADYFSFWNSYNAKFNAAHLPALSVPGVGHLQILRCPWAGHLPTPGPLRAFDTHAVSYQNITTQRILLEKQADWLIFQGREKIEEVCKGMFSILCMHFFIAYQAKIVT